LKKVNKNRYQ